MLNLVIYLINIPIISIQNAMGLHRLDASFMVVQAICSVLLAYIGGLLFGMPGIFFGLLVPLIIFTTIRKGVVITKEALNMDRKEYFLFIGLEIFKILLTVIASGTICSLLAINASIISFIIKGVIAVSVGIIIPGLLSFKSSEFKYACALVQK